MKEINAAIEKYRVRFGKYGSDATYGNNGAFNVPIGSVTALCVVSDGLGWEHVSVSMSTRCPTWDEMCFIKDFFWQEEESVVQYHPPRSEYINLCGTCLHLWRPVGVEIPRPPRDLVG